MSSSCSDHLGLSQCRRAGMPPPLGSRGSRLLLVPASLRNSVRFRCIIDAMAPRLAVSSSLGAITGASNVIAAAAAVAGSTGASHAGVTSALAHVAVTAVAIASGACLSTKVDFLWPRLDDQPDSLIIDGVDLTGYPIFKDAEVQKAVSFARIAHYGQFRKTGEPYVTHCIHTGRILAALVPATGKRAVNTVVAGILHDVIDDTIANLSSIENEFGEDVARLVAGVSKLSYINQLLRRHRQKSINQSTFTPEEPHMFRKMRAELAYMWNPSNRAKNLRRLSNRAGFQETEEDSHGISSLDLPLSTYDNIDDLKDLLQAVLPFDLLQDRKKRTRFVNNLRKCPKPVVAMPKVVNDAAIALESLTYCEEALERELLISISYIPGMEVDLSSRLKSLYSIYCKMKRKDVDIRQVYDARALRVIVGDRNGTLHGPAVKCCYSLLDIVHRLWTPIDGEFDDYVVNPKPTGYQSLHTAVLGPDSSPIEVQIRTQRMHKYAESGHAAHWLYKENKVENSDIINDSKIQASSCQTACLEDEGYIQEDAHQKYGSLKVGQPVLRIEGSQLLAAVIIRVDKGGRELLVAVSFALEASQAVAERRFSFQIKRWEAYARLYKRVSAQWWFAPGHGDWCTCLEKYTLCRDGMFHKEDQFQRLLPTFIQVIDMSENEKVEYWNVVSAVFEGKQVVPDPSLSNIGRSSWETDDGINNKVNLLRTMLQWEEQVRHGTALGDRYHNSNTVTLNEVVIIRWPNGEIMRLRSGSTAADVARRSGDEGKLVLVNGQLVQPHTELKDGDILEVRV
ncbi:uncharacterized protein LOC110110306 isoform X3 [Dendrobium catenatum]|uniref:uncharacterized protein LOC110110306 isoform X3 n=1 Tax=Dendrobium catenatum TaxID=906689 RepID=UPI0009F328C6|nr:uncharacterized protein LOC110110306 isoform X3 [Dendrobium catenatum]